MAQAGPSGGGGGEGLAETQKLVKVQLEQMAFHLTFGFGPLQFA